MARAPTRTSEPRHATALPGRFVRYSKRACAVDRRAVEGETVAATEAEIEERPTQDLDAFELYLQAKTIIDSYINATDVRAALLEALKSLDEAIKRDPNFVSAYCYVARAKRPSVAFSISIQRQSGSPWPKMP